MTADPMATVCAEGDDFLERNPDVRDWNGYAAGLGALAWGLWRALAECDDCPGVIRLRVGGRFGRDPWDVLACPNCGGVWHRREPSPTQAPLFPPNPTPAAGSSARRGPG
jgi:hypothetical protein